MVDSSSDTQGFNFTRKLAELMIVQFRRVVVRRDIEGCKEACFGKGSISNNPKNV